MKRNATLASVLILTLGASYCRGTPEVVPAAAP